MHRQKWLAFNPERLLRSTRLACEMGLEEDDWRLARAWFTMYAPNCPRNWIQKKRHFVQRGNIYDRRCGHPMVSLAVYATNQFGFCLFLGIFGKSILFTSINDHWNWVETKSDAPIWTKEGAVGRKCDCWLRSPLFSFPCVVYEHQLASNEAITCSHSRADAANDQNFHPHIELLLKMLVCIFVFVNVAAFD